MKRASLQWSGRRALSTFLVASVIAATAAPAIAQTAGKPDAAAVAEAKRKFDAGLKLYKEGSFREALAAFLQAKALAPRESIQRNIAQCYRELKDFAAAYDAYQELLDTYGPKLKKKDAEEYQRALDDLKILTGSIRIQGAEPDARVSIDDRDVGKTPLAKPVRVGIGSHKVMLTKQGFEPFTKVVEIKGSDEVAVEAAMQREIQTGKLAIVVDGDMAGAHVYLDGSNVAGPFPWEGDVQPGTHNVELKGGNVQPVTKHVDVTRAQRSEVTLEARSTLATVTIEAGAPDAKIFVDGREVGQGAWQGNVPPGKHEARIVRDGYEPAERAFIAQPGEPVSIRDVQLVRLPPPVVEHDYTGVYVQLHLLGAFGSGTSDVKKNCPATVADGSCSSNLGAGGGLGVRVGYSFGWVGLEGFVLGAVDTQKENATYPHDVTQNVSFDNQGVARTEAYNFVRFGGSFGAAVRFTSMSDTFRVTGALGGGMTIREMGYIRDATATNDATNSSDSYKSELVGYRAPMAIADIGILLGSTPGAKFHLGLMGMAEFIEVPPIAAPADRSLGTTNVRHLQPIAKNAGDPTQYVVGTPQLKMAQGTAFFFGPILGVQFGELRRYEMRSSRSFSGPPSPRHALRRAR